MSVVERVARNIREFEEIEGTSWTLFAAVCALDHALGRESTAWERKRLVLEYRSQILDTCG